MHHKITENFWNREYKKNLKYQRFYPSEELSRFIGRNYKDTNTSKKNIKVLDIGCGVGNNLNLLINENFKPYGIDLSKECIFYLKKQYKKLKNIPELKVANMKQLPFKNNFFNLIIDVFSSYTLNNTDGDTFLKEVNRCLKKRGKFFSIFPSKDSDSWKKENKKNLIDKNTLFGFKRKKSPYFGNNYPFRFMSNKEYTKLLKLNGFKIDYLEKNIRTYNSMKEKFEFLIIECTKIN